MPSFRSPSPDPPPGSSAEGAKQDGLRRHFVEALRRAEIVSLVNAATGEQELARTLAEELCEVFDAEIAFLIDGGSASLVPRTIATVGLTRPQALELLTDPLCVSVIDRFRAVAIDEPQMGGIDPHSLLLSPFRTEGGRPVLIGVARLYEQPFDSIEKALLEAVTESACHALERIWAYEERDRRGVQQAALVRAAKALNRSLEIEEVLSALCEEITEALEADKAAACMGSEADGYTVIGIAGLPESYRGFRRPADEGLPAIAIAEGRAVLSEDYAAKGYAPTDTSALDDVRVAIVIPLRWDGVAQGYLAVGWTRERRVGQAEIELSEGFAELAALACANAERHAKVRESADLDQLTGCLNQGAFRRVLRSRITISDRDGAELTLVLLDLDNFKIVNDTAGHPAGDSVLREVGSIVLAELRGEDLVARYGGDEFALVLPGIGPDGARPVVERLLGQLPRIEMPGGVELSACAGIARWHPGELAQSLIDRTDAALLEAKRAGRASVVVSSEPVIRRPAASSPQPGMETAELRRRRRELSDRLQALAGRIGLRISREDELAGAAQTAAGEVGAALEAGECVVVRKTPEGRAERLGSFRRGSLGAGATRLDLEQRDGVVQRCLRERRSAIGPRGPSGGIERAAHGEELAVPVFSGETVWGAIACHAEGGGFGPEDAKLCEAVAEHLGTTTRAIELNEDLRRSLIGTAESLAAALEAKDSYTAEHARSIAGLAVALGRELNLDEEALEDLRYGAIFHDIGKIAIPDAILNKEGPLTAGELEIVRRHPVAGEEILAPVPLFSRVRKIVRHDHEHWDGSGYPDGLQGRQIPLGARIVLVVDAYHAMVTDRPYRSSMSHDEACRELRTCAGTQFDPDVVGAFMTVAERQPALLIEAQPPRT